MTNVSQNTLQSVLKLRSKIEKLHAKLDAAESVVLESLKAGAVVQNGMLVAEIKTSERRNVAWKPILVREVSKRDGDGAGEKLAERILNATKPDTYENLVVKLAAPTKKLRKAA
jgi:hypothetical protein